MRCLGRIPSRRDSRTFQLRRYLGPASKLPGSPPARDWTQPFGAPRWGMYGNNVIGDCAEAACGHLIQAASAVTGRPVCVRLADIEAAYAAITGWDPARPETDQGSQMLDVLRYWRTTGIAGVRIDAFVALDPQNDAHLEAAVNLFGGVYLGLDLPISAQTQTMWDVAPRGAHGDAWRPGSWGGHAVAVVGYDRLSALVVSWGALRIVTRDFVRAYASEAYTTIGGLWAADGELAPSGFDRALLNADLEALVDPGSSGSNTLAITETTS